MVGETLAFGASSVTEQKTEQAALDDLCRRTADRVRSAGRPVLAVFSTTLPPADPLSLLAAWQPEQPTPNGRFRFYWEHPEADFALAAAGSAVELIDSGPQRFQDVERALQSIWGHAEVGAAAVGPLSAPESEACPHAVGGFSFFDALDERAWPGFQPAQLVLPQALLRRREGRTTLLLQAVARSGDAPQALAARLGKWLRDWHQRARAATPPAPADTAFRWMDGESARPRWISVVRAARDAIRAGELRKVVLARCRELVCERAPDPLQMLRRLRAAYPQCFNFVVDPGQGTAYVGATPERLLRFEPGRVQGGALAGTFPRGSGPEADLALGRLLLESPKEREEHAIVVEAILEAFAGLGRVEAPEEPVLRKLRNVQHLFTPITLVPHGPVQPLRLVERLHPTPAVGGQPREAAFRLIRRWENFDRGWYGAPLGWINARGEGEFAVALRSGTVSGQRVRLFAGGGIVADSDPEREYEETQIKFQPLLSSLGQE